MIEPLLPRPDVSARHITKRFGSFKAVDNVSLHVAPGSFNALLGENGAGKSTLVKCLMGFHHADEGQIEIDGRETKIASPRDARAYGLGMVFQHFTLIPSMTIAENLVLARPDLPLIINWKTETIRLEEFLEGALFHVDLKQPVSSLAAGEKQKVEILKELYLQTRFLILDEPTSVLTPREADEVLGFLRKLVDQKSLSILLITHKFREITKFCDHVTILRKGRLAGTGRTCDLDPAQMAEIMMGEPPADRQIAKKNSASNRVALQIESLSAFGDNGLEAVSGVDVTVRSGEIVGIAGVSGNGQRELVEVIGGQRPAKVGRILVNGCPHVPTRKSLRKEPLFTLPEEPLRNAAVPNMSVADNMTLRVFDRPPFQKNGFLLNRAAIAEFAQKLIHQFSVRPPSGNLPIGNLSGGNVQRAILARELSSARLKVLVAANPCAGLDFKAVDFIHNRLIEARNQGTAVLLISEDLDELLALSDRIFVMSSGRLVHETVTRLADISEIGRQMAGHH